MSQEPLRRIVGQLRQAHAADPPEPCTDAVLLARWVDARDQAAFADLVTRYAPLVLGVCRRVLRDAHEAEDAAQAVFIILARKAGAIGTRQALASWLYRVAYRAALHCQARLARQPTPDAAAGQHAAAPCEDDLVWRDLRPVLDEEVARLPETYRTPFVLCHLEGRTNADAARTLGCPIGTVLSRLARARARLRSRLARRGITLSAAALAAACERGEAIPPMLLAAVTTGVARCVSGAPASLTPVSTQLVEGIMRTMLMERMRRAALIILMLLAVGATGTAWLTYATGAAQPPAAPPQQPKADGPVEPVLSPLAPGDKGFGGGAGAAAQAKDAEAIAKLKKTLLETARKTYEMDLLRMRNAQLADGVERMQRWSRNWLEAQRDLATNKAERLAAYREHLDRMRALEKMAKAWATTGQGLMSDATAAEFYRAQAELWLEEAATRK